MTCASRSWNDALELASPGACLRLRRQQCRGRFGLNGVEAIGRVHAFPESGTRPQIGLGDAEHHHFELRCIFRDWQVARFFRGLFSQADDGVDHRLHRAMAEHHGTQHDLFGQFLGFGFDHQHRIGGAGDDQIERGIRHVVDLRIKPVFAVDVADTRCADRPHEGNAGNGQRCGSRDQRHESGSFSMSWLRTVTMTCVSLR